MGSFAAIHQKMVGKSWKVFKNNQKILVPPDAFSGSPLQRIAKAARYNIEQELVRLGADLKNRQDRAAAGNDYLSTHDEFVATNQAAIAVAGEAAQAKQKELDKLSREKAALDKAMAKHVSERDLYLRKKNEVIATNLQLAKEIQSIQGEMVLTQESLFHLVNQGPIFMHDAHGKLMQQLWPKLIGPHSRSNSIFYIRDHTSHFLALLPCTWSRWQEFLAGARGPGYQHLADWLYCVVAEMAEKPGDVRVVRVYDGDPGLDAALLCIIGSAEKLKSHDQRFISMSMRPAEEAQGMDAFDLEFQLETCEPIFGEWLYGYANR